MHGTTGSIRIPRRRVLAGAASTEADEVPDVPNVLSFSLLAEALHARDRHDNFGNPMSHGCVNLPTDVVAWMCGRAPLGTAVVVRDRDAGSPGRARPFRNRVPKKKERYW